MSIRCQILEPDMSNAKVDAWFHAIDPTQRSILLALRGLIFSVLPDANEALKWSRPCYANARGLFCYLYSTKAYATLGFQHGAALDDPEGLLEGTGKDMRHIKFTKGRSPNDPSVVALLKQAAGT
jgi:hypothetical protein